MISQFQKVQMKNAVTFELFVCKCAFLIGISTLLRLFHYIYKRKRQYLLSSQSLFSYCHDIDSNQYRCLAIKLFLSYITYSKLESNLPCIDIFYTFFYTLTTRLKFFNQSIAFLAVFHLFNKIWNY